jgi:CRP-like cAMP-binding protein
MVDQEQCCNLLSEAVSTVFSFLTRDEVQTLCPYLSLKDYPAKSVLMRENEIGDFMGFILEGKLAVKKESGFPGKHIMIAVLEAGTMVGESSVVEEAPRSSRVEAVEDSRLLILSRKSMEELIEEQPSLAIKMLKRILHIVSLRSRKCGDRLAQLL